jgi:hypothetical protein
MEYDDVNVYLLLVVVEVMVNDVFDFLKLMMTMMMMLKIVEMVIY